MSDIKYKIGSGLYSDRTLCVSIRKSFWGKDIYEYVPKISNSFDSTYNLDMPKLEGMCFSYFDGGVSKEKLYKFMEEYNTKDKYLNYVKGVTEEYNLKYEEYLQKKDYIKNKLNLYE